MKTVKRIAKEGERVLVVGNRNFHGQFEAGAIFTATDVEDGSYIWKGYIHDVAEVPSDKSFCGLRPDDYEVIVEE